MYEKTMNLSTAPMSGKVFTKKQLATKGEKESNRYNRDYANSPVFPFANAEMLTGTEELFDFFRDNPKMEKYGSFTNFNIVNVSSEAIIIYLNQARDRSFFIPASTSRTFAKSDIQGGVQSLIIANAGSGTIAVDEIRLEVFKVGEQFEDAFQKIHKKFFKLGAF
jgi:hypothetical protein